MPLSEEELRLLEQMERALVAEDPKFASTLRGTQVRARARRTIALGVLGFVVGVSLLMAGAVLKVVVLGVVGFVLMLGAAYVSVTAWRGQSATAPTTGPTTGGTPADRTLRVVQGGKAPKRRQGSPKQSAPKPHGSMMERFEERWRRRRDQRGF